MTVKYQIFVSSTYEDLKDEREQVLKAILEMGHLPVGMELFSAADEEQWKLISRQIDESDYYVVIVAHRYGSTDGSISYTEKEYDYAVLKGVPTLGFIIDEAASWPANKMENDQGKIGALKLFKEKVRRKPVGFWKSAEDLYGKVSIALTKQMAANPRTGWVRASDISGPDTTNELARLSKENSQLRKQLSNALSNVAASSQEQIQRILRILAANTVKMSFYYKGASDWSPLVDATLHTIFSLLAPELIGEETTERVAKVLAANLRDPKKDITPTDFPIPSNYIKSWLADLSMLGLVEPSTRKHLAKDPHEYWTLTELGRSVYGAVRLAQLERVLTATTPHPQN